MSEQNPGNKEKSFPASLALSTLAQSSPRPRSNSVKRKLKLSPPEKENKKNKMDLSDASIELIKNMIQPLRSDISVLTENQTELSRKVESLETNLTAFRKEPFDLNQLKDAVKAVVDTEVKNELKEEVKNELKQVLKQEIKDEIAQEVRQEVLLGIKEEIRTELRQEFQADFDQYWTNTLLDEIRRHETGLIIKSTAWTNGYSASNFINFCVNCLKFDSYKASSMTVKSVSILGRPKSGPNPRVSVLVSLGSVRERNECLSNSFNLHPDISIDKYVPKRYEAKYVDFKEVAWKIRTSQRLNTWVGFDGHRLVIKQKRKDDGPTKFGWEEFDFWIPTTKDPAPRPRGANTRQIPTPSPALAKDSMKKMVFATKVKSDLVGQPLIDKLLNEYVQAEDGDMVTQIEVVKKHMVIFHLATEAQLEAGCRPDSFLKVKPYIQDFTLFPPPPPT